MQSFLSPAVMTEKKLFKGNKIKNLRIVLDLELNEHAGGLSGLPTTNIALALVVIMT